MEEFLLKYPFVDYLLRILVALILGFSIGFERKSRAKEAGIRTHAIVAVGAALFTVISKYGFGGDYDSSRVAAQVVAGVGFLGAGMIMHQRHVIHGLTTAAGIWATAGVGMAAAAGMYGVAIGSTILIIGVQILLHANIKFFKMKRYFTYKIAFTEKEGACEKLYAVFGVDRFTRLKTERKETGCVCVATVKTDKDLSDEEIANVLLKNDFVISCESFSDEID